MNTSGSTKEQLRCAVFEQAWPARWIDESTPELKDRLARIYALVTPGPDEQPSEPSTDAARWREFVARARDIIRPELMAQWQASEIPSALAFVFDGMVAERLSGEPVAEPDGLPAFYTVTKCSQCGHERDRIARDGCQESQSCGRTAETKEGNGNG